MKKRKTGKKSFMSATTTSKDWGFGPIPGKGGKTTNSAVGDTMIHRELKDHSKN